jgi:hypothetical protein
MLRVRKQYDLKGSVAEKDGVLAGMASPIGRIDRSGDVPFPGLYKDVLAGFLKNGFVPVGHNWSELPVAYPVEAFEGHGEAGYGLYSKSVFHSTDRGQEARTVCRERLEAGLAVGLSVGMLLQSDGYIMFESGEKLLEFAAANGYDLNLFDVAQIKAWGRPCWGLMKCAELCEYSIVSVPMAPGAQAQSVKGEDNDDLRDDPRFESTRLKDHLADLLLRVTDGTRRVVRARTPRVESGRDLPPERKAQIRELKSERELKATIVQLTVWVDQAEDGEDGGETKGAGLGLIHRALAVKARAKART